MRHWFEPNGERCKKMVAPDVKRDRDAVAHVVAVHGVVQPGQTFGRCAMSALLVGYARCSTDQQDLTAQRDGLLALDVEAERIYVDHGLTGTNRERPGPREALALGLIDGIASIQKVLTDLNEATKLR